MQPITTHHFGDFALDDTDDVLWHGQERCHLTAKAWAVLRYLVAHAGHLVRKTDLFAAVWPDVSVSDWVLTTCIHEIRHTLGDVAHTPRYIETVHRQGYRFIAPVTVSTAPPLMAALEDPRWAPLPAVVVPAAALDTTYKPVTLLCGAFVIAPALVQQLGPEGLSRLLPTLVAWTQEVLQAYGGTCMPPTQEGFTAVFGAPMAQEDHARRAVLAALDLRQRLYQQPALQALCVGEGSTIRLGVHSGLAVIGDLGYGVPQRATTVEALLSLATRLQEQAAPGTILLSVATYHLVQAEVQGAACGTLDMYDHSPPVPVYMVQGLLGRYAGVLGRGAWGGSPFVGRERELALLHECLATAVAGQGQVIGLVGEPGIGKTRLVSEFCRRLSGQALTVVVGQCLSYGQGTPYLLVRGLLRQLWGLVEGDAAIVHTAVVQQRLHASGITAAEDLALLYQLLDLPVAPGQLTRLSPETRQARTFALLRHVFLHAPQPHPLVLVVENLHWSDATSTAWLTSLVEQLAETPVLLLGTYRPGYQPPWATHSAVTQVALRPLRPQDSLAVARAVLGTVTLPAARLREIVARAGGNPFFIEELTWDAREQGRQDVSETVPGTVQAVLAARLDRLPPEAKRLLQTAAVVGMELTLPLLEAVTGLADTALQLGFTPLLAAEFLYETRVVPECTYTFKHILTQDVAYSSLLPERRRLLHAAIVAALEGLAPVRLTTQVERLAHHALRGEVWDKAVAYCRQAGTKAIAHSAYHEAVTSFEQALEALQRLPATPATQAQAIDLRLDLRNALWPLGELERILVFLQEAAALAEALDDQHGLGWSSAYLLSHFRDVCEPDHALVAGQRALAIAATLGDVGLMVATRLFLGHVYRSLGDYPRAVECLQRNVACLQGALLYERLGLPGLGSVHSRTHLVYALVECGAFAGGRASAEEAVQIAEAVDHPFSCVVAYVAVGYRLLRQGEIPQAIPVLERALDLIQAIPVQLAVPWVAAPLGAAYTLAGRTTDALLLLEQAINQAVARRHLFEHALRVVWLGEAYLLAGQLDEAGSQAQHALAFARAHQERGHEAYALRLLGKVAGHRHPLDAEQAEAHYCQALALAKTLGMRPLQAHCHRGLGTLYAMTGQQEQARTALAAARNLYCAMEMTFWLPQVEAQLSRVA